MQDKELDDLFFSNLKEFEMEPSANVWAGIAQGLDEKPERRVVFGPMLRIAASVVILITAGLMFWPKNEQQQVQQGQIRMASNQNVKAAVAPNTGESIINEKPTETAQPISISEQTVAKTHAKTAAYVAQTVQTGTQPASVEVKTIDNTPQQPEAQMTLAAVEPKKVEVLQPVVPETTLSLKEASDETPAFKTAIPVLAQVTEKAKPEKKHRIHNLGDLVNMVVSKVDKRENKLIEFSETDDEDSRVTGINLGLLKLKSDK